MWFKKLVERIDPLGLRFQLLPAAAPSPLPNRVKCLKLLHRLQPALFDQYSARDAQGMLVTVLYPRIDQYTQALREASQMVRQDRAIPADWIARSEHRVTIDRFLTSLDGYYLNPQEVITRFKATATQLCEALEASDEITYGVPEHNLRMLSRLLVNLQSLTQALVLLSNPRV